VGRFVDDLLLLCKYGITMTSGLDLFYKRLLLVGSMMHTKYATQIAKRRTKFLKDFLNELKLELKESKII
jgi:HD superfamily phosphodiesterase